MSVNLRTRSEEVRWSELLPRLEIQDLLKMTATQEQSQIVDNRNYRAIDKDGSEVFLCNICEKEAKTVRAIKLHITKHHITKPKVTETGAGPAEDEDDDDPFPEADALFEQYGVNPEDISLNESIEDVVEEAAIEDQEVDSQVGLGQAVERIRVLEGEVGGKRRCNKDTRN